MLLSGSYAGFASGVLMMSIVGNAPVSLIVAVSVVMCLVTTVLGVFR
jgi:hypothetical protein